MSDNYLLMFLNSSIATGNITAPLTLFFLFLGRILPIIGLAPFFGSRVMPHPVKMVFAMALFVIFLPHLLQVSKVSPGFNLLTLVLFAKELFIGYILGFIISIPFTIVQTTGMVIDHQRGGASLMVNDPTIQNQSSPIGTLFNMVLIYIFYVIDGPFLFIDALILSYDVIPPDKFINGSFFAPGSPFWESQIHLLGKAVRIATQLATPALLAILMTDVFLGIANRLATQVQITFLGMPLKSLLALTVLCIGWKIMVDQFILESYSWLNYLNEVIGMFSAA